jgi:hypothetical protein
LPLWRLYVLLVAVGGLYVLFFLTIPTPLRFLGVFSMVLLVTAVALAILTGVLRLFLAVGAWLLARRLRHD